MKKIQFYGRTPGQGSGLPFGIWGIIWRTLVFLLALAALVILLSFFRACRGEVTDADIPGSITPTPRGNIDNPGGSLPGPDDNFIPPVNDDDVITDPGTGRQMVNNRVNVILDSDAGDDTFRRWSEEFKQHYPDDEYKVLFYDPLTKLIQIQVPAGTCQQVIRELPQKITDISFKPFQDGLLGPSDYKPSDPAFRDRSKCWYFAPIQAYGAWNITQGSEEVVVAIVDSYFDLNHDEFCQDRIVEPFSVVNRNRDVAPPTDVPHDNPVYYHGTSVASMALGNIDNGSGACGIAPKCKFMPVSMGSQFTSMTLLNGILYAIYRGASVINASVGIALPDGADHTPIEEQVSIVRNTQKEEEDVWEYVFSLAEARGVTIVWAAGNSNVLSPIDPSKRSDVSIYVSALDHNLHRADFSNFGNLPEHGLHGSTISTPGVDILGAIPGNQYKQGPGTSYAAPLVTGAVALMKSLDSTLRTTEIISILQETGKPVQGCTTVGPLLQIKDALSRVKNLMTSTEDVVRGSIRGIIWKILVCLLALAALIMLLCYFRVRRDEAAADASGFNTPIPRGNIDNPGGNLPTPDDNFIPPANDDDITTDPGTGRQMVNNRVNVILDSDAGDDTFRRWSEEFKQHYPGDEYKVVFYDSLTKLIQFLVPVGACQRVIRELPMKITDISFKPFQDGLLGPSDYVPSDPAFRNSSKSWYFAPIQAYGAWDITQGSEDVVVAIVDSYFDLNHIEFSRDRIVEPFSVVSRTRDVAPPADVPHDNPIYYHGTCVASMALGNIDNGSGACGIAPKCKFMPVSMGSQFTSMTLLNGILYAIYRGASVINASVGIAFPDGADRTPIEDQVRIVRSTQKEEEDVWEYVFSLAEARGVTIVWAAGNSNVLSPIDPSKRSDVSIYVSALDRNLRRADFSNFGNLPEHDLHGSTISTPGVDILGAMPGNQYKQGPGTSYAAPLVTGAVALMKSLDPTLRTTEIISILQETGKPVQECTTVGPLLQIKDALSRVNNCMASSEDIMRDHHQLVGVWQSTAKLKVLDADTMEWTGEYQFIYFDFTSPQAGTVIHYVVDWEQPCHSADVCVVWDNAGFVAKNTQPAGRFVPQTFHFSQTEDGLLQFSIENRHGTFRMKRVSQLPCDIEVEL